MLRTIHFHLDENCPNAIAEGLRRRGIDVTTTPEAGLIGATDEEQTGHALGEGRVIFTQDQDFLAINAAGVPHAGIVYCRQGKRTIGQIIAGLTQVWETMEPEQMKGWLIYL
jgi:predicted nuclease of predicted toxin-antitoxin system